MKKNIIKKIMIITVSMLLLCACGGNSSDVEKEDMDTAVEEVDNVNTDSDSDALQTDQSIGFVGDWDYSEVINSDFEEGKFQICDMVFRIDGTMTPEEVRKVIESSKTGLKYCDSDDGPYVVDSNGKRAFELRWMGIIDGGERIDRDNNYYGENSALCDVIFVKDVNDGMLDNRIPLLKVFPKGIYVDPTDDGSHNGVMDDARLFDDLNIQDLFDTWNQQGIVEKQLDETGLQDYAESYYGYIPWEENLFGVRVVQGHVGRGYVVKGYHFTYDENGKVIEAVVEGTNTFWVDEKEQIHDIR